MAAAKKAGARKSATKKGAAKKGAAKKPKPAKREKYGPDKKFTEEQVRKALETAGGSLTGAARLLDCHRGTIWNYTRDFPDLKKDRETAKARVNEMAEDNLVGAIVDGDIETSKWWMVRMNPGEYSTRIELTGKNGGAIEHNVKVTKEQVVAEVGEIFNHGPKPPTSDA